MSPCSSPSIDQMILLGSPSSTLNSETSKEGISNRFNPLEVPTQRFPWRSSYSAYTTSSLKSRFLPNTEIKLSVSRSKHPSPSYVPKNNLLSPVTNTQLIQSLGRRLLWGLILAFSSAA